ncbi:MAG: hypothetical protein AAGD92_05140 [Pseudomonadota bacterium]
MKAKTRYILYAGFYLNFLAIGATADSLIAAGPAGIQPPCRTGGVSNPPAPDTIYIIEQPAGEANPHVAIIRSAPRDGWASRYLLSRFDVKPEPAIITIASTPEGCIPGLTK